jgi:DNA-binding protein HU-beta
MTKAELIKFIADEGKITRTLAEEVLGLVAKAMTKDLTGGEGRFILPGCGIFKITTRKAYEGIHPKTRELIDVPEKTTVKFKPAKLLLESLA